MKINLFLTCHFSRFRNIWNSWYKVYVLIVALSIQDNVKLLQQLKSGFKKTIYLNKYQSKVTTERQNQYLDYLSDPSFQGINILFVLLFENN